MVKTKKRKKRASILVESTIQDMMDMRRVPRREAVKIIRGQLKGL
jgi:hypothetical protein